MSVMCTYCCCILWYFVSIHLFIHSLLRPLPKLGTSRLIGRRHWIVGRRQTSVEKEKRFLEGQSPLFWYWMNWTLKNSVILVIASKNWTLHVKCGGGGAEKIRRRLNRLTGPLTTSTSRKFDSVSRRNSTAPGSTDHWHSLHQEFPKPLEKSRVSGRAMYLFVFPTAAVSASLAPVIVLCWR